MMKTIDKFNDIGVEAVSGVTNPHSTSSSTPSKQTCQCKCGGIPKEGKKYIHGHNRRDRNIIRILFRFVFPWLCECGCGEIPKTESSKYCWGHHPRTEEEKRKQSEAHKGKKNTEEHNRNISKALTGVPLSKKHLESIKKYHKKTPPSKEQKRKQREARIKYIEKTGRCHPALGKNEKQILDEIELLFQMSIERDFRIIGYFPDGYIRELNLIIEIDEPWHYNCDGTYRKRDIKRQKNIEEELGCTFLRIKDVPTPHTFI